MAWFNQPKSDASLMTVVPTSQITERESSLLASWKLSELTFFRSTDDLARMERKGAKPGVDITASEHLQARLASTYKQLPPTEE
jgi:hypothetical protein